MSIIIEYNQSTGLGDQYTNIYSVHGIYLNLLSKINSSIYIYSNSDTSCYFGHNPASLSFYSKIFDYSLINEILFFNTKIPNNFILKRNWNNIFKFYSDNNSTDELLTNLDINFYHHGYLSQLENSYNPLKIQPLINNDIINSISHTTTRPMIVFHLRFEDGWHYHTNPEIYHTLFKQIEKISLQYLNHDIVIGGRGDFVDQIQNKHKFIIKSENYLSNNIFDSVINSAKDMVLFSYADKIYTYCKWPTSFLTYSILHNKKQKQYTDLIENIL